MLGSSNRHNGAPTVAVRMPVATHPELTRALESGDFDAIVDTPEGQWLDFKSAPHDLGTHHGKADLVADVAAFANTDAGGILVIGVHEAAREGRRETVASKVKGVALP